MAPVAIEGGSVSELNTVLELKEWLYDRVQDDNDIVVDDLQADHNEKLDMEDERAGIKGTKEWSANVAAIAAYKEKALEALGTETNGWHWDGFRRCRHAGNKEPDGKIVGQGQLIYENKDTFQGEFKDGILNRVGVLTRAEMNSTRFEGEWVNGLLEGEVKDHSFAQGWLEGYYKDGVPHGFFREFGARTNLKNTLRRFGRYYRGVPRGWWWFGHYEGSGWTVGKMDKTGELTGDDIAYIYPDMKMALKGRFEKGVLVRGQICELIGCYEENDVFIPVFSQPSGQTYEFEAPSIRNIAKHPLLRDPFEEQLCEVGESRLPQGGEGLFAKRDLAAKEVASLYNGIKVKTGTYASEHMPRSDYRIRLNGDWDMDIPKGYHQLKQYCATLAHKANHSFTPNVEWGIFEHPRFGLIRSLRAIRDLKKGDELLVNYHMTVAKSPEWYRQVWLQWMRKTKKDDAAIQRYIDRQYELQGYRIPLPESEELCVPEPEGVDLGIVPEEYLTEEAQSEEAAHLYSRDRAGLKEEQEERTPSPSPRFEEITD